MIEFGKEQIIYVQCEYCKHMDRTVRDDYKCPAFPRGGIPETILHWGHDHREPYKGDHGIRFETRFSLVK